MTTNQPADLDRLRRAHTHYDHTGRDHDAHELAAEIPALIAEIEQLRADNDQLRMYERTYNDVSKALDELLGPDEEDGCGQGLVAEIWHLARRCGHFDPTAA